MTNSREHWNRIYRAKAPSDVSWYQPEARMSVELIQRVAPRRNASIIDVGGGASTLADGLLDAGYSRIAVLDLAEAALEKARTRLGERAALVHWILADVLEVALPRNAYDVWHDRAVFHFLTAAKDRARYVAQVRRALRPGGHVVVASFAEDGPERCSGLDAVRYSPNALHAEFGDAFHLLESTREDHHTPWGASQAFVYCLCRVASHEEAESD